MTLREERPRRILCYGDSNTWGFIPGSGERYSGDVRWTGALQTLLGDAATVVEEGVNGRTSGWDDATEEGRNGRTTLGECLASHLPLDIVILALGTNDLKVQFQATPEQIRDSLLVLAERTRQQTGAAVVLLSPPAIGRLDSYKAQFEGAEVKRRRLANLLQSGGSRGDYTFVDSAVFVEPGEDGVHLNAAAHRALGHALSEVIRNLLRW